MSWRLFDSSIIILYKTVGRGRLPDNTNKNISIPCIPVASIEVQAAVFSVVPPSCGLSQGLYHINCAVGHARESLHDFCGAVLQ